ncbi:enoyl-CoA hydratase/isomerase family protein [Afifella pfennigii]|uniref:enoyl-CoA hydratase/isomerase family protein n=1 Tax=Afifella pfennigii TaxID=209897 RepID=UPI00047A5ABE|nr:enoyl-CoA hydratase/isomerase family protein [Afifella pfennigii]
MKNEAMELTWPAEGVAQVTLTRAAEMNTLTHALLDGLEEVLASLKGPGTRALIITGSGRAFCCGAHLDYFAEDRLGRDAGFVLRDTYLERIARIFDSLEEQPYPVIAAINGFALGGGCELALSCDFRLMSKAARIGLPEVKLGAIAGAGGVQKLARHVGRGKALEWILLASHVDAEEAERRGLVYAVTEPDQLLPEALHLADHLKGLSPRAIAQSKAAIYLAEDADLRSARRYGLEALSLLVGSEDWKEGIAAFHAKRPPQFG